MMHREVLAGGKNCESVIELVLESVSYTHLSDDGIYRMNRNGENDEKLLSGSFYNLIYLDGKLYYLSSDGICLLDINSKKTEVLKANVVNFLNMNEQYLFYQSMDCLLYTSRCV